jgi:DNA-binding MarR family transcriptional regulator
MSAPGNELSKSEASIFEGLIGYHLRRLSVAVMTDLADSLAPLGLRPAEASVLFMIDANPGITQSDVAKELGILRANMTPLIAALVKRDLIQREPVDGRSQALTLSSRGDALTRKAWLITRQHENRMFGTLSESARIRVIAQLRGLWRHAR